MHDGAIAWAAAALGSPVREWEPLTGGLTLHWMVMDAVGFLPPPGREPMFGTTAQLTRLDEWLHELVARHPPVLGG